MFQFDPNDAMKSMSTVESPRTIPVEMSQRVMDNRIKRALDIVLALSALVFLAPLLIFVALLVRLDSPGPILFRQKRTGFNGRPFQIYKFRSMYVQAKVADGEDVRQAQRKDSRITRVGGILRRSSIDELPQLFNVLKGDMSLVGPRPHALAHDLAFERVAPAYRLRFRTRPGLTGLAQVNGLRGEIHSPGDILRRSELDNAYVERWSLMLDIRILAKTAVVLFFQQTAY